MAEKLEATQDIQEVKIQRPKRAKLTAEETLKRMEAFDERKEQIVAAVRKARVEVYLPDRFCVKEGINNV